jgi:glycerol-3-phosphate cytidylyltransferase
VVERYIQLKGCFDVDEIVPTWTEQDLEDILRSFKLDVRIREMSTGRISQDAL